MKLLNRGLYWKQQIEKDERLDVRWYGPQRPKKKKSVIVYY